MEGPNTTSASAEQRTAIYRSRRSFRPEYFMI